MKSVLIAIPTLGEIRIELARQLFRWARRYGDLIDIYSTQTRPLWVARNECADVFLRSGRSWLIFIDSDIIPPETTIDRLTADIHHPVVGALAHELKLDSDGRVKPVPMVLKRVARRDNPDFPAEYRVITEFPLGKLIQVDATGTQCISIHRSVFEKIPRPWFSGAAEDFAFCERCADFGISIFIDTGVECKHVVEVVI